jgi:hypothetical protein
MRQCENCYEWADDLYRVTWPIFSQGEADYLVCDLCLDHLADFRDQQDPPEIGSEAAQRDYKKTKTS